MKRKRGAEAPPQGNGAAAPRPDFFTPVIWQVTVSQKPRSGRKFQRRREHLGPQAAGQIQAPVPGKTEQGQNRFHGGQGNGFAAFFPGPFSAPFYFYKGLVNETAALGPGQAFQRGAL